MRAVQKCAGEYGLQPGMIKYMMLSGHLPKKMLCGVSCMAEETGLIEGGAINSNMVEHVMDTIIDMLNRVVPVIDGDRWRDGVNRCRQTMSSTEDEGECSRSAEFLHCAFRTLTKSLKVQSLFG
ncbi:uncharacterized protein [Anabrus simplex]|uniref:uncharacterized protein n=1 Tax=Anabrus simplex TaxID=316456 RepID=UPI0034DCD012